MFEGRARSNAKVASKHFGPLEAANVDGGS